MRHSIIIAVLVAVGFMAQPVMAQETEVVPTGDIGEVTTPSSEADKVKDGWHFKLRPSANLMFDDNRNVVGKQDGYSLTFGMKFEVDILMLSGPHEWRNNILLAESVSRTPVVDAFNLSEDTFHIESIYLYYVVDWFGVYGRFVLDMEIFEGYDIQPKATVYQVNGSPTQVIGTRKKLTSYILPLTLKQGLGPFFRPLKSKKVNLEFLLGLGFSETFADGDLILDDSDATPNVIELTRLTDIYLIGGESINRMWGELWEGKINYKLGAELFYSFYEDPERADLTGVDRMNVNLYTRWSFRIFEWMSLDYEFRALREPYLSTEWQISNNILFSFSYAYDAYRSL